MRDRSVRYALGAERSDAAYQRAFDPTLENFVRAFGTLLDYHREAERERSSLSEYLFKLGVQVKEGQRTWTKGDVNAIIEWKRLQPLWQRIQAGSEELEAQLRVALLQPDDESRVESLCRIPGFGPVLASALLTLTWPETYGVLGNPSWQALGRMAFGLSIKPYSGGGSTVAESLKFERIIRSLSRPTHALPAQVSGALNAFYKKYNA